MADLLTHYVSGRIAGVGIRTPVAATLYSLGVFLPDLIKTLGTIPGTPYLMEVPSHTPLGLIFACTCLCLLFAPSIRWTAFWGLYLGSQTHLALDLMKDYLGSGSVFLLHPFSMESFEFRLYRSEDVFYFLPANLAILAILWAVGRRRRAASPDRPDVTAL